MTEIAAMESKFAGRRKSYLAQAYPQMYAEMEQTGQLNQHLDQNAKQAFELMQAILDQYQAELETIQDPQRRKTRAAQIWLTAEEIALYDVVLTL